MTRVLVVTSALLGTSMAGPAIRATEMARELAGEGHDVHLATFGGRPPTAAPFTASVVDEQALLRLARGSEMIIVQGDVLPRHPELCALEQVIVVDLYDPFHFEQLEWSRDVGDEVQRRILVRNTVAALNLQLDRGDFFLCASGRQRDLWLGHLSALGRINTATYDADATLAGLLAIVPFGTPAEPPVRRRRPIKGVVPGIGADDRVLLWGGGIYNWLDPFTLLAAMLHVRAARPDVKLLFLGTRYPDPALGELEIVRKARRAAADLGLLDSSVVFGSDWVPYEERGDWLLDSDVGVTSAPYRIESEFAYRTRVLDYFWAGLPVVLTRGDATAELVERRQLGLTVAPGDPGDLAGALLRLVDDEALAATFRVNVELLRPELRWASALRPLLDFAAAPRRSPDLIDPAVRGDIRRLRAPSHGPLRLAAAAGAVYAETGVAGVARSSRTFVRGRVRQLRPRGT